MSLKPRNVDFQETWKGLRETVSGVVRLQMVERCVWNNRFSDVYALCVAQPEPLADRLYDETRAFLHEHVASVLRQLQQAPQEMLLTNYEARWREWAQGMQYLNALYSYLNLQHIKRQKACDQDIIYGSSAPSFGGGVSGGGGSGGEERKVEVGELGLRTWERVLIEPLRAQLTEHILRALQLAREHRLHDAHLTEGTLRAVIHSLVAVRAACPPAPTATAITTTAGPHHHHHHQQHQLALYEAVVEAPYLAAAARRHAHSAHTLLHAHSLAHYMTQTLLQLDAELELARRYLQGESVARARAVWEQEAVGAHCARLQEEGARLVREERAAELRQVYRLLRPLQARPHQPDALQPLLAAARDHVAAELRRRLLPATQLAHAQPDHFVRAVIDTHHKYTHLFNDVFNNDQAFIGALDQACAAVINERAEGEGVSRAPELLARYCDHVLRRKHTAPAPPAPPAQPAPGSSGEPAPAPTPASSRPADDSPAEIEDKLAAAITVFKYIDDKDVFQRQYARALARRLIHQLSAHPDLEELMINRLKHACGYEFTNKLHRMFTDVAVSADLNTKFHQHLRDHHINLGLSLNIQVLQAGAWPLGGGAGGGGAGGGGGGAWGAGLERGAALFEEWYKGAFSGRRLAWLLPLCTADIRTKYTPRPYTLVVGAAQSAILLAFERPERPDAGAGAASGGGGEEDNLVQSVGALCEAAQLGREQLVRQLRPLLEHHVLTVASGSLEAVQGEEEGQGQQECLVRLNTALASKRARLRLAFLHGASASASASTPTHHNARGGGGGGEGMSSVEDDRKMYLQACIVRIMKARKMVRHCELVQEVVVAARAHFAPSTAIIKKCVEALIDKQYLERAPHQPDTYTYLA